MEKTKKKSGSGKTRRLQASRGSTASRRRSGRKTNAIAMLRDDHERVQALFTRYERTRGEDQKGKLAEKICNELKVHAQLEEEIFYPAVREATKDNDLMDEATVEHQTAKDLIYQIEKMSPGDELYDAKVKVLGEYIKHHVKEEHGEMFPEARKSGVDLEALGEAMKARREKLNSRFFGLL